MFLGLVALQLVIYHGVEPCYDFYPLIFFCFILLFITSCSDIFSFVLCCSSVPTSSVTCTFHPNIQSGVSRLCTWYFYHAIALSYDFSSPPIVLF